MLCIYYYPLMSSRLITYKTRASWLLIFIALSYTFFSKDFRLSVCMVIVIRLHGRRKQILCVCVCAALFGDGLASQQRAVGGNERVEVNHLEPGTTGPVQSRHCSSSLILFTQSSHTVRAPARDCAMGRQGF